MIRSACPSQCGLYLTVEELREYAPVVASSYPVSWNVVFDESTDGAIRYVGCVRLRVSAVLREDMMH